MKKITLIASVLLAFFTAVASAHGPVRQKAEEQITINAPAEKVWALIKNFGDMSWHPDIFNTTSDGG
ncbi:MAG: SRPBCC family protein, partial [Methylococcaceae bacterium]|nr:SRPBCC family protein [Methylococcaceae bacterium]